MSHSYFLYETGEQKLERLRKQRIDRIKKQLREAGMYVKRHENMADILSVPDRLSNNRNTGFSVTKVESDELASDNIVPETVIDSKDFGSSGEKRKRIDLSTYLDSDKGFVSEKEEELKSVIKDMDSRIPDSDKARAEYERMKDNIERIVCDDLISVEDKIFKTRQLVDLYIENRNYDNSALDEDLLLDYRALCILLGIDEEVIEPEMLRSKVDTLFDEYTRLSDKEIVADAVSEALEKIGLNVEGSCVLDAQVDGEIFSLEEDRKCKVFISCDESGIMIEPVNVLSDVTEDVIMSKQKMVCETERKMIEEAAKNGVKLTKVYSKEHEPSDIATDKDIVYEEHIEEKDNPLDKQRNYNKLRRNRRRREQEKSRSIDL